MGVRERLRGGLARTREVLTTPIEDLVRGRRPLDAAALERVEEALLAADMGLPAVTEAMEMLRARSGQIASGGLDAMRQALVEEIRRSVDRPAGPPPFSARPWVVFVVGVNGTGKTTTIGKLAAGWTAEGRSVLLCAADTFRAAAAEQLSVWAGRAGAAFHRGAEGADPAAVLTDALRSARAHGADAVLVDTAGRLHTKSNLMAELAKMARVAGREVEGAPHETLLVLTKLDGTAKGGVAVAVVRELGVPIRYVGVGEKVEDLLPFDAAAFAASLVGGEP
jgi:fused signal recognition particle receptor